MILSSAAASAVTVDWVTVGLPGNAADVQNGHGSVGYTYRISRYEVTNTQYAEFLNAVAMTDDPNGLYNTAMASGFGGISRSGTSGSYTYSPVVGRELMPVNYVSFWDALRFANWLHNGQLSGTQDVTTTEDGAYTLTAEGIAGNTIQRNSGAQIALPDLDEWYKAAYHNALGVQATDWFNYPTANDSLPTCSTPSGTTNRANCEFAVGDVTTVGSYSGSGSAWETFDQGGNVWEWSEAVDETGDGRRILGGVFTGAATAMGAGFPAFDHPSNHASVEGFRLVMIPEPSTGLLVILGLIGLGRARRR